MSTPTVCKFWLQGKCSFGNNCRNLHSQSTVSVPSNVNAQSIRDDLTKERPYWPFTVYAPFRDAQSCVADVDWSFEEARWMYVQEMKQTNNSVQYEAAVAQRLQVVNQKVNAVLADPAGAIAVGSGKSTSMATGGFGTGTTSAFGQTGTSAFGQAAPSAFGSGMPSAFGKPSAFGATNQPTSAFGAPAFGSVQPSAFGAASTLGNSVFGSTSAFGATPTSAFGNVAQPTSAFGTTSQPAGGFGTPSAGAFGAVSQPSSAFGANPTSAFGGVSQPGAFGAQSTGGFGAQQTGPVSQPAGAFGTSQQARGFGTTSQPIGVFAASQPAGVFGATPQPPATENAFGTQPPAATVPTSEPRSTTVEPLEWEKEAFAANHFVFGRIPLTEPPIMYR